MGKFLNETGLSYFWTKTKEYLKKKYVGIGDTINYTAKDGNTVTIGNNGIGDGTISFQYDEDGDSATLVSTNLAYDGLLLSDFDGSTDPKKDSTITRITAEQIDMATNNGDSASLTPSKLELNAAGSDLTATLNKEELEIVDNTYESVSIVTNVCAGLFNTWSVNAAESNHRQEAILRYDKLLLTDGTDGKEETALSVNISAQGISLSNPKLGKELSMDALCIESPKFVKTDGTANQVLLANGDVAELNAANGIPKLDANGMVPLSQLGNLDTTLFEVLPANSALPIGNVKKNRIYLLPASDSQTGTNKYDEYIYTGDVDAIPLDSTKWEKLGSFRATVDLANCVASGTVSSTTETVSIALKNESGVVKSTMSVAAATSAKAGVMTAADKSLLNVLLNNKFPLQIAKLTATPSLVEVGKTVDIKVDWDFENADVHPLKGMSLASDSGAEIITDVALRTNTIKDVEAAGSAGTKTLTLGATYYKNTNKVGATESKSKEVTITYHYPSYIGVVAKNAVIGETAIKALTKSIEWGKGKKAALTQSSQKIVYAYPAEYGDLTSIKDGNGFEGFAGYTKTTLDFTINGNKVTYNVYIQKEIATSDSTYTFA